MATATRTNGELMDAANWVRRQALEMVSRAGRGHIGGSLSITDVLVALYLGGLLDQSTGEDRDRLIMSKGHAVEALYAVLARANFFSEGLLSTYGASGSTLGGHADHHVPGVDVSTGALGHGLGIGAGLALAAKLDGRGYRTVVVLGDGECYEGAVWESAMFAAQHDLANLIAIVDRNGRITLGETEDVLRLEPLTDKWEAFGWRAIDVDGHSFDAIRTAWAEATTASNSRPTVLIAKTIKGRGISFMESSTGWHHNVPRGDLLEQARRELEAEK